MTSRTQTVQEKPPTTPLIEDQIWEYCRNQRCLFNAQQATRRLGRRLTGRAITQHTLEQQIDPQAQLQLSMRERAAIAPAEVLYHSRPPIIRPPLYNNQDEEVPSDEKRLLAHTIAVLIEESVVQVKRLTTTVEIPKRQSEEAAGYDLLADEECTIESRGRGLVSTGLCLTIPFRFYRRIATRSSAALKMGLHVGVGVIDSDYRGEVKILLFNHTIRPVFIKTGDRVAQIIIQQILQRDFMEVTKFQTTQRGTQGFGSTQRNPQHPLTQDLYQTLVPPKRYLPASTQSTDYQYPNPQGTYAGATRPGPSVLRSIGNLTRKATEYITTLYESTLRKKPKSSNSPSIITLAQLKVMGKR
ncbi:hypothetical protein ZIOFF_001171 [Zingiber officinale]|uniref:Deoxyuridine 5'-triphosphate nucleotidohydrolase n=1 Tax=Zingiber officinale TaxID=94328 RepID=A0A8J5HYA2_ZINOF|nr:hypothetical protein ZIOFF_001171 [Zingiber officinale]